MPEIDIDQWLMNPPDGKFLTAEHVFLPHTFIPGDTPGTTAMAYLTTFIFWGGGGWLIGHMLDRDATKWARNGAIIGVVADTLGMVAVLAGLDWASRRVREQQSQYMDPGPSGMGWYHYAQHQP